MEKIKKRTKEEKISIGRMNRSNNIGKNLNCCFEKKSLDEDDHETILRWACFSIPTKSLIYLFEKIKFERLKNAN